MLAFPHLDRDSDPRGFDVRIIAQCERGRDDEEDKDDEPTLPNSAVTVVHGHLIIASHVDFLEKIITGKKEKGKKVAYPVNQKTRGKDMQPFFPAILITY